MTSNAITRAPALFLHWETYATNTVALCAMHLVVLLVYQVMWTLVKLMIRSMLNMRLEALVVLYICEFLQHYHWTDTTGSLPLHHHYCTNITPRAGKTLLRNVASSCSRTQLLFRTRPALHTADGEVTAPRVGYPQLRINV